MHVLHDEATVNVYCNVSVLLRPLGIHSHIASGGDFIHTDEFLDEANVPVQEKGLWYATTRRAFQPLGRRPTSMGTCCSNDEDMDQGKYFEHSNETNSEHASRRQWKKKWRKSLAFNRRSKKDSFFSVMVRLYAHKRDSIGKLYQYSDAKPKMLTFYTPQVGNFLLHGSFFLAVQLECFIMDKSQRSLRFAHRIYWFLKAFGTNVGYRSQLCSQPTNEPSPTNESEGAGGRRESSSPTKVAASNGVKDLIESLQLYGALAALTFDDDAKRDTESIGVVMNWKPSKMIDIPCDVDESLLSPRWLDGDAYSSALFQHELSFLDTLDELGMMLINSPIADRNSVLRDQIRVINDAFLPSSVIYLPVYSSPHRVVNIIPQESFCFNTRERVPFMLCIEIVDSESEKATMAPPSDRWLNAKAWASNIRTKAADVGAKAAKLVSNIKIIPKRGAKGDDFDEADTVEPTTINKATPRISRSNSDGMINASTSFTESMWGNKPTPSKPKLPTILQWPSIGAQPDSSIKPKSKKMLDEELPNPLTSNRSPLLDSNTKRSFTSFNDDIEIQYDRKRSYTADSRPTSTSPSGFYPIIKRPEAGSFESLDSSLLSDGENEKDKGGGASSKSNEADEKRGSKRTEPYAEEERSIEGRRSTVLFKEQWTSKEARLKKHSLYSHLPGWRLIPVIMKNNDDLRQEQIASQLLQQFDKIFKESGVDVWMRPYEIIATSATSGLLEAIPDTISIDSLKRNDRTYTDLADFFLLHFSSMEEGLKVAKINFMKSLAAYCIVTFLLQVKDRHNGNILLDAVGHIIHIDFGFMLSNSPGGNRNFESAPFKMTNEYIKILGGPRSALFRGFRAACVKAFMAARESMDRIILLVEMMIEGNEDLPCFSAGKEVVIQSLRERFRPDLGPSDVKDFVHELIESSNNQWSTRWYDKYQYLW